mmetsp:Transcript_26820/g.61833  ORF Transcript_26820/g.61833 Transcript_26820/m.61833 type:complete len:372 (-) Transcript_26820:21-1136(-)
MIRQLKTRTVTVRLALLQLWTIANHLTRTTRTRTAATTTTTKLLTKLLQPMTPAKLLQQQPTRQPQPQPMLPRQPVAGKFATPCRASGAGAQWRRLVSPCLPSRQSAAYNCVQSPTSRSKKRYSAALVHTSASAWRAVTSTSRTCVGCEGRVPCRKAAKGECLGVPALLFLKMTGQPLTVATQKAVDKVTIDVITPYVMASTAPRKKQATTQPVGETVALSFSSMLQAQAESAAALEGSGNLLEMSLSMLRATTASLASQLVQGYSPPPVTMALVEAAGKWSSNALSFELFRASLPDDEDLRDMVERAALGRREALAGSIAASALADSLRRSGVPGAEISQTFLLTGVPTTITVGKAEQQQVLHRVIRTGE